MAINATISEFSFVKISSPFNVLTGDSIIKLKVVGLTALQSINTYSPFEVIYNPVGLTEAQFNTQYEENVIIVELLDCKGNIIRVPESSVTEFTENDVTEYIQKTMAVTIGIQPVDIDLSALETEIADLITARVGVVADVVTLNTSNVVALTTDVVTDLEAARTATTLNSTVYRLELCTAENVDLTAQVATFQQYIVQCDCTCN